MWVHIPAEYVDLSTGLFILGALLICALVVIAIIAVAIRLSRRSDHRPRPRSPDPVEQIQRLAGLRDEGLLSAADFEAKRAELLGRI
jgi:hypothetical protein